MNNAAYIQKKKQRSSFQKGYFFAAIVVALALLFAWRNFGYPQSLAEARFLFKLKSVASENVQKVNLTELMPGNWETVCESQGYYGPLYVKKYNKTFPAAGAMQDGAWGLIFIKTDGTSEPISSSCGQGAYIDFPNAGCFSREGSVLIREVASESRKCASFQVTDQLEPETERNQTK